MNISKLPKLKIGILAVLLVLLLAFWNRERILSATQKNNIELPSAEKSESEEHGAGHEEYEEPESEEITKTHIIEIKNGTFSKERLEAKVNDVIGFKNSDDTPYTVVSDDSEYRFSTNPLSKNETQNVVTYTKEGTYTYYLKNSPNVKGTIVIED